MGEKKKDEAHCVPKQEPLCRLRNAVLHFFGIAASIIKHNKFMIEVNKNAPQK